MSYDWAWWIVPRAMPALFKGLQLTLLITVAVIVLGFLLAIFVAAGRLARSPLVNKPVAAYIEFFRGPPRSYSSCGCTTACPSCSGSSCRASPRSSWR